MFPLIYDDFVELKNKVPEFTLIFFADTSTDIFVIPFNEDENVISPADTIEKVILEHLQSQDTKIEEFGKIYLSYAKAYESEFPKKLYLTKDIPDDIRIKILCCIGYDDFTKDALSTFPQNFKDDFWNNVYSYIGTYNTHLWDEIIQGLLGVNRIREVVNIAFCTKEKIQLKTLIDILKKLSEIRHHNIARSNSYNVIQVFKKIYTHKDIDSINKVDFAKIEIIFLSLFNVHLTELRPKFLYAQLEESPEFYFDMVTYAYKNDDMKTKESTENQKEISFKILHDLDFIPGLNKTTKNFNVDTFSKWINNVLEIAKTKKYLRGTVCALAHMLSRIPNDEDGVWPHKALRDILEQEKNSGFENQLAVEKMNRRGVTTRSATDNGDIERNIAKLMREQIKTVSVKYPRTARVLDIIAKDYESYAKHIDNELKEREF